MYLYDIDNFLQVLLYMRCYWWDDLLIITNVSKKIYVLEMPSSTTTKRDDSARSALGEVL